MAWIGGSLAGALKTGGAELSREKWDEMEDQDRAMDETIDVSEVAVGGTTPQKARSILPDWTRSSLPTASPANVLIATSV